MDNEKGKSIIPTGTSNLAKTEKLLSITQKILSEIKPQYQSVRIGNQEWMTRNLDVDRFRNGDLIPHAESNEEWKKAGDEEQPAWCYYDNDPENGKKYGKLYNKYAVIDLRGLAPKGWYIPTCEEWTRLEEFLGTEIAGHKMKAVNDWECSSSRLNGEQNIVEIHNGNGDNSSGFNALPGGFRFYYGFDYIGNSALFWSATESDHNYVFTHAMEDYSGPVISDENDKSLGASVRCIKDSSDSKWAQAVKNGTIKPYIPPGLKLK